MIQKILTPIDIDGESSEQVIKHAIELSKIFGAKLIYFHTYKMPLAPTTSEAGVWTGSSPQIPIDQEALKERQFKRLIEIIPEATAVPYEYISLRGMAADLLTDQAEELNVNLILMGTNEVLGIEAFIGTLAETVTRNAPCPVIVVPRNHPYKSIKRICLAVDPDHSIDEQNLSTLLLIAKGCNIPLDIAHVQRGKNEIDESQVDLFEQLKKKMEKYQIKYSFSTIPSEDVERGIVEFTKRNQIDLLALVYREHGFFKRLFNPGLRKKLVSQSVTPLLILK